MGKRDKVEEKVKVERRGKGEGGKKKGGKRKSGEMRGNSFHTA